MAASRGDFIAICGTDSLVRPGWLETMVAVAANSDIVGVAVGSGPLDLRGSQVGAEPYPVGLRRLPDSLRLTSGGISGVWRATWESIGGWIESSISMEDLEFGLRAELAGYSVAIHESGAVVSRLQGSTS